MASQISLPTRMSSVSFRSAVLVLWYYFLKPEWKGSSIFYVAKKFTAWSYANFSRTLERKHSKAIGQKSDDDEGTGIFFRAMIQAVFKAGGKTLLASEELKNLVRKKMTGNALIYNCAMCYAILLPGLGFELRHC